MSAPRKPRQIFSLACKWGSQKLEEAEGSQPDNILSQAEGTGCQADDSCPHPALVFSEAPVTNGFLTRSGRMPSLASQPCSFPLRGQGSLGHSAGTNLRRHSTAVFLMLLLERESRLDPREVCCGICRCCPARVHRVLGCACRKSWASASCVKSGVGIELHVVSF